MIILSELKKNKNAPGFALFADGKFAFSIDIDTINEFQLEKNMSLPQELFDELKNRSLLMKAREKALRLLDMRAHSRFELFRKVAATCGREAAESVCISFAESGLIDDEAFADLFARELLEVRRFGRLRIKEELFRRGIDRETASAALEHLFEEEDHQDPAEIVADEIRRRFWNRLETEKGVASLIALFQRRGYRFSDIRSALKLLEEETESAN